MARSKLIPPIPTMPKAERIEWWPRANLRPNPKNVRTHSAEQLEDLANVMRRVWTQPMLVVEDEGKHQHGMIIVGHGRFAASDIAGYDQCKVMVAEGWSQAEIDAYAIFDNQIALRADWSEEMLLAEIRRIRDDHGVGIMHSLGFTQDQLDARLNPQEPARQGVAGSLAAAFGVPPFSVLNAREGWWQQRKNGWIALGIQSELGRGDHVEGKASHRAAPAGGGRLYAGRKKDGNFAAATNYGKTQRVKKS